MNNIANELRDIADKAEAGEKLHWAKAMRVGAKQIEIWQRDIETYRLRLDHCDEQSKQLGEVLEEFSRLHKAATNYCMHYLQDELGDPDLCYSEEHHTEVVELWDALGLTK